MRYKGPEDLSVQEIRFLLVDKRRTSRNIRLDCFRKTGRVMPFIGDSEAIEDSGNGSSSVQTKIRITKTSHGTWLDVLLLGMEILAVVGMFVIVANGLSILVHLGINK